MAVFSTIQLRELFGAIRLDAEFYQPKYQENEALIEQFPHTKPLGDLVNTLIKGIFDINSDEYVDHGIPFVRITNLRNGMIYDDNIAHITPEWHKKEAKTALKKYDLILSKTAYPAASIVQLEECNTSQDTIAVRTNQSEDFNAYLAIYLNTKFGLLQMERLFQGNIQSHLSLPETRTILIPIPREIFQKEIRIALDESIKQRELSRSLYAEAEALLLDRLGFDTLDLTGGLASEVSFKEVAQTRRYDAEHFRPKFRRIRDHILSTKQWKILGNITIKCERGVQPDYTESGTIPVVNTKHLGKTGLVGVEDLERTNTAFSGLNANAQLQWGDALLYSTGAYIGRTNYYPYDQSAIGSNHVTIIRADPKQCDPVYLSIFLNSPVGLAQTDQYARGSAQREIYPIDLWQFVIWLPERAIQEEIASKATQAHEARQKAKELLAQAKARVEEMILNGNTA